MKMAAWYAGAFASLAAVAATLIPSIGDHLAGFGPMAFALLHFICIIKALGNKLEIDQLTKSLKKPEPK
jgi:hypothetical protein